jgi:ech hydrogenase subunit D
MNEQAKQSIIETKVEDLLPSIDALRSSGWRLVQILCIGGEAGAELSYSLGLDLELRSLRIVVPAETSIPSITTIYPCAFLYENEIRDLFGVRIERIAGDWEGKVYDVAGDKPFSKVKLQVISSEGGSASAGSIASSGGAL